MTNSRLEKVNLLVSISCMAILAGCAESETRSSESCFRPLVNPVVTIMDETARDEAETLIAKALKSAGYEYDGDRFTSPSSSCYIVVENGGTNDISIVRYFDHASIEAASSFDVALRRSLNDLIRQESMGDRLQTASIVWNVD